MSNRHVRSVATVLAFTAATALALTSCAGNGAPDSSDDAQAGGADERIRVSMMSAPAAGLDPYSDEALKLSRWSTGETLVQLDENIETKPMLATDWVQVDDLTWKFTIREGVTFHDGTELTPETVVNALESAAKWPTPPRVLNGVSITPAVTGDDEVTITTDVPDPLLPSRLANPQLAIFAESAYEGEIVDPIGTGTGPFVIASIDGTTTASLDRYDDYWGDPAGIAGIDVSFVPDGLARAAAIRTSESDVVESIPVAQLSVIDEGLLHAVASPRSTFVALNTESGPFADPAIRAAARAAVDPEKILEAVYEGNADLATGLIGPAVPWAADLRGDVSSSTAPGDAQGVEITLATWTDRAELPEIAVQLQSQLEAVGFVVTMDIREWANIEGPMLEGEFDAVVMSRGTLSDTGDLLSFFTTDFTCEGGFNTAQLCDAGVDSLISTGLQTPIGEDRQKATMAAEAGILQIDAAIPLVHDRIVQGDNGAFTDVIKDPLERRLITAATKPAA